MDSPRSDNDLLLLKVAQDFKNLVESYSGKLGLQINQKNIQQILDAIKASCNISVVACGPTKSGKTTLLNFLIGPEAEDLNDAYLDLLLTGVNAETSVPWIITGVKDLPNDSVLVRHLDYKGEVGGESIYCHLKDLKAHLKERYSRSVIEEQKQTNQSLNPYTQVQIAFQIPDTRLNATLFGSPINIVDLQGLDEPGADTFLKMLPMPYVLVCCFNFASGFLKTAKFDLLKELVAENPPQRIIFIFTHIEETVKKIQNFEDQEAGKKVFKKGRRLEYGRLLPDLKSKIDAELSKHFNTKLYELYHFDPFVEDDGFDCGIQEIRKRIASLGEELQIKRFFSSKVCSKLIKDMNVVKNEICTYDLQNTNRELKQKIEDAQNTLKRSTTWLSHELPLELRKAIDEDLEDELLEVLNERRNLFMESNPNTETLARNILDWLVNDGIQTAFRRLVVKISRAFLEKHQSNIERIFDHIFTDTSSLLGIYCISTSPTKRRLREVTNGLFLSRSSLIEDLIERPSGLRVGITFFTILAIPIVPVIAAVGFILGGFRFIKSWINNLFPSPVCFQTVATKIVKEIMKSLLKNRTNLYEICENQAHEIMRAWETGLRRELEAWYGEIYEAKMKDTRPQELSNRENIEKLETMIGFLKYFSNNIMCESKETFCSKESEA